MANSPDFVKFIIDQIHDSCEATYSKMFGGGTLYSKGKVVALVCDDQLFIKPTEACSSFIGDVTEAPAFRGAKMSFLIQDGLDDSEWLTQLIRLTDADLPNAKKTTTATKKATAKKKTTKRKAR